MPWWDKWRGVQTALEHGLKQNKEVRCVAGILSRARANARARGRGGAGTWGGAGARGRGGRGAAGTWGARGRGGRGGSYLHAHAIHVITTSPREGVMNDAPRTAAIIHHPVQTKAVLALR